MSSNPRPAPLSWKPCPPGTLVDLSQRMRGQRQRRHAVRLGGLMALVIAVAIGVAVPIAQRPRQYEFGGITCREVQRILPAYVAGTLPAELAQRVQQHLLECPNCAPHQPPVASVAALGLRGPRP